MPNWNQMLDLLKSKGSTHDIIRRQYIKELSDLTGRNVIIYYSGWLQKPELQKIDNPVCGINDEDKNGFMGAINGLDRADGLDLILHTPGGDIAAVESLVDYLRKMFGNNIRAIIPQLAMSGGTMIACASKTILMGKQSSLGPIDPQYCGIPAHGVVEEFLEAHKEITTNPATIPVWQPIIAKYPPAFIGECKKSIQWSEQLVREWLRTGMFESEVNVDDKIDNIIVELGNHAVTLAHARHLSADKCAAIGLNVEMMEDNQQLQDAILSVHHAAMLTMSLTPACKIIENQHGAALIKVMQQVLVGSP